MDIEDFKRAWLHVFPNSACHVGKYAGGCCFAGRLLRDEEQANRIVHYDPLQYVGWMEGDNFKEDCARLLVKPPPGANLVYGSAKLRCTTIKNVTFEKLVKRFEKVRDFCRKNAGNMKHDISGKV